MYSDARGDISQVRADGHPPVARKVVAIDFDGTIYPFGDLFGWQPPLPGARDAINQLHAAGYRVVIFTSRLSSVWLAHEGRDPEEQLTYIRDILKRDDIKYDSITSEKIPAEAYFDDKTYEIRKDRPLYEAIAEFRAKSKENGN